MEEAELKAQNTWASMSLCRASHHSRLPRASRRPSSCPPVRISWASTLPNERAHARAHACVHGPRRSANHRRTRAAPRDFCPIQSVTSGDRRIVIYSLILTAVGKSRGHHGFVLIVEEQLAIGGIRVDGSEIDSCSGEEEGC